LRIDHHKIASFALANEMLMCDGFANKRCAGLGLASTSAQGQDFAADQAQIRRRAIDDPISGCGSRQPGRDPGQASGFFESGEGIQRYSAAAAEHDLTVEIGGA
jgi:hypothetical protein